MKDRIASQCAIAGHNWIPVHPDQLTTSQICWHCEAMQRLRPILVYPGSELEPGLTILPPQGGRGPHV